MSKEEILERVVELMTESFGIEAAEIFPTTHLFDDLDLDSIDAIDLVVGLEEETGLRVSENELREIRLVQDIVDLVHRKLEGG